MSAICFFSFPAAKFHPRGSPIPLSWKRFQSKQEIDPISPLQGVRILQNSCANSFQTQTDFLRLERTLESFSPKSQTPALIMESTAAQNSRVTGIKAPGQSWKETGERSHPSAQPPRPNPPGGAILASSWGRPVQQAPQTSLPGTVSHAPTAGLPASCPPAADK